jgi:hypothetical protein
VGTKLGFGEMLNVELASASGDLCFLRLKGRRNLFDDAGTFRVAMDETLLGWIRAASGERQFLPLGLEGRNLSVVTYEFVGDERGESMSEAGPFALWVLRAVDLFFLPKIAPSKGIERRRVGESCTVNYTLKCISSQ